MRSRLAATILSLSLLGSVAHAQAFNLDVGDNLILWPVPSGAYGAAAGQPGFWNDVNTPYSVTLSDLTGTPTTVTCTSTITSSFNWPFGTLPPDDSALMDDVQSISPFSGTAVWTFSGLADGNYVVYTYGWAPDSANARTSVDVPGSSDPLQIVGGAWAGSPHVLGVTYALHHASVTGGTLVVNCAGALGPGGSVTSGSVNGFQLVPESVCCSAPFCVGDGGPQTVACPCSNFGLSGQGCNNSASNGGASLTAAGTTSPDTIVLTVSNTLPTSSCVFLQGSITLGTPVTFGDGVRCIGGTLKRLYVKSAQGGSASAPEGGDLSVSSQSAALGDPIGSGTSRHYQVYYRDPDLSFCLPSPATFNVSNALSIAWP